MNISNRRSQKKKWNKPVEINKAKRRNLWAINRNNIEFVTGRKVVCKNQQKRQI